MATTDPAVELRRLYILRILKASADYRMGDELLQESLKRIGHAAPMAVLRADLAWLEQVGLVATTDMPGTTIALLRNDGVDVAEGISHVPGIARPRPE
jgi:hypothetical protein